MPPLVHLLIVLVLFSGVVEAAEDVPLPPFFLAKETTYFSGPVRRDGTVDYVAAMNEELGRGVTKENNAAIPFLQAVTTNPQVGREVHFARLWAKLGLDGAPPKVEGAAEAGVGNVGEIEELAKGPWVASKAPQTAKWLEASRGRLDLIVAASGRERFFLPLLREREDDFLASVLLPHLQEARGLAWALRSRAMLRLGSDDTEGFLRDAIAIVRMGRLMTQATTLIEKLVAHSVETIGLEALRIGASGGWLSEQQARTVLAELDASAALARSVYDSFGMTERAFLLEFLQVAAVQGAMKAENLLAMMAGPNAKQMPAAVPVVQGATKDWNAALRRVNEWYERILDAGKKPTFVERRRAMDVILKDVAALKTKSEGWQGVLMPLEDRAIMLFIPAIEKVDTRQTTIDAQREVTRAAVALSAYRTKNGRFPADLKELAPEIVRTPPVDPFTNKGTVYRPSESGYVLLSVGPDGEEQPRGQSDDIVVRVGK